MNTPRPRDQVSLKHKGFRVGHLGPGQMAGLIGIVSFDAHKVRGVPVFWKGCDKADLTFLLCATQVQVRRLYRARFSLRPLASPL